MSTSSPYTTGSITVQLTAALGQFIRVKRASTGKVVVATIDERGIGCIESAGAADEYVACRLLNADGIHRGIASEAIVDGDEVFTAADGKISKTSAGAHSLGTAIGSASADGVVSFIPVIPNVA